METRHLVPPKDSDHAAGSYWHMAKTIASGVALTNAWLADQGLLSLKTLWAKLASLR